MSPTAGAVLIDGVDVRQIDPADIRKNIGIMLQDSWLFSGTVRENIQMGYNEYDDKHILNICKIAGVDDFIGSNPKGYDLKYVNEVWVYRDSDKLLTWQEVSARSTNFIAR